MTTGLLSRLERSIGHTYAIERELGGGGMARVFVASDRAHGLTHAGSIVPPGSTWRAPSVSAFAMPGDHGPALSLLRDVESGRRSDPTARFPTYVIMAYLAIGDTARALTALEHATDRRENWPTTWSMSEKEFDVLRASPRFAAVVRRVGLDERIFTSPTGGRPR